MQFSEPNTFLEASLMCMKLTGYIHRRLYVVKTMTISTIISSIIALPMLIGCFFLDKTHISSYVIVGLACLVGIWAMVGKRISASYGIRVLKTGQEMSYLFDLRDKLLYDALEALIIEGVNDGKVQQDDTVEVLVKNLDLYEAIPTDYIAKAAETVRGYSDAERKEKYDAVLPRLKKEWRMFKKN